MTAAHIVDPSSLLVEAMADASPDLMRSLLQTMINALLSEHADTVVGAEWGKPLQSVPPSAMVTATATWIPGWARSMSRCRS